MKIDEIDDIIEELGEELKQKDEKERLLELKRRYHGSDEIISAKQYYDGIKREKILYKAFSGLKRFDSIIEGFRPGTVIIVSGPTKQGKTTFCQTLTKNFTATGFECLWFSFDTPPYELIERFDPLPEFYLPKNSFPDKKLQWLEEKIIEGLAKYNTRIIFIDHLGSISRFTEKNDNHATELTAIVRELKEISMRWNVTIFLNHHIQKINATTTVPNWSHLKDSSGPGQESDITLMIRKGMVKTGRGENDWQYDGTGKISVELNRRGRTGLVDLIHKDNLFYEDDKKREMDL